MVQLPRVAHFGWDWVIGSGTLERRRELARVIKTLHFQCRGCGSDPFKELRLGQINK